MFVHRHAWQRCMARKDSRVFYYFSQGVVEHGAWDLVQVADARTEAIKRQATSAAAEYDRLFEENESLRDQLQLKDALEGLTGGNAKKKDS
jgi:hypothetical protein